METINKEQAIQFALFCLDEDNRCEAKARMKSVLTAEEYSDFVHGDLESYHTQLLQYIFESGDWKEVI